uniref:Uncharacterized protein n=1 Tax=Octopus bimaculoides TaxID=37653 RepID=A0A0L8GEL5_OCTBM
MYVVYLFIFLTLSSMASIDAISIFLGAAFMVLNITVLFVMLADSSSGNVSFKMFPSFVISFSLSIFLGSTFISQTSNSCTSTPLLVAAA